MKYKFTMAPKKPFFEKIQMLVMGFVRVFREQFPELCVMLETKGPVLMYECTRYFTMFEKTCKKHGIDRFFRVEKAPKRTRAFHQGFPVQPGEECDLVFYEVLQDDGKRYTVKRFESVDAVAEFEMAGGELRVADNVNMLGLQCQEKESGRKFDINLNDEFFVEGNVLFDKPMVRYFLKEFHNTNILDSDEYMITFIDQNMDVRTITDKEHILIQDGDYLVQKN